MYIRTVVDVSDYLILSSASYVFFFHSIVNPEKIPMVAMSEIIRAYVVCTFTSAAATKIAPSQFSFPVFGPIICGTVGGCGAAFMPLSKGLDPMKEGLTPPMATALFAATGYHLFLSTSLSDGCIDAAEKAQFHVAFFFISVGIVTAYGLESKTESMAVTAKKKEE